MRYITVFKFLKIVVAFSILFSIICYKILLFCCNRKKVITIMDMPLVPLFYEDTYFNPRLYLNNVHWEYPPKVFRQPMISFEGTKIIIRFENNSTSENKGNSQLPGEYYTEFKGPDTPKKLCPVISPNLKGPVPLDIHTSLTFEDLEEKYSYLQMGGRCFPPDCMARQRVAIIVPYRDRYGHLRVFLNHMHSFLRTQQLDYTIFVIELNNVTRFNKGVMFNAGFVEANVRGQFDCFIFHDVDLIPENDENHYSCLTDSPKHLSVAINVFNYTLTDHKMIGGVNAMSTEQYILVNGYSNKFYGWGGEDDDLYYRIRQNKMVLSRYTSDIARYFMLKHKKRDANPIRYNVMNLGRRRWRKEGLNSLKYTLLNTEILRICTYLLIDFDTNDNALSEDIVTQNETTKHSINR